MAKYKTIVGRAEVMDLPDYLLVDIPSKTDTGAFTSSIHATNIREVKTKDKTVLKFSLLTGHSSYSYGREVTVPTFTKRSVENSFGQKQERYAVIFKVRMAGKIFNAEFTLADRSLKTFPILIGRTMLNHRFLVDTDIAHIDRKTLKENLKEWLAKDDKQDEREV